MLLWIRWSKKQQCPQTSRFHNWSWKRAQHLDSNCYWPDYRSWTRSNHQTPNQAKRRFVCLLQATPLDQAVAPSEAWKNALPQRMHREANLGKTKTVIVHNAEEMNWNNLLWCHGRRKRWERHTERVQWHKWFCRMKWCPEPYKCRRETRRPQEPWGWDSWEQPDRLRWAMIAMWIDTSNIVSAMKQHIPVQCHRWNFCRVALDILPREVVIRNYVINIWGTKR